MAQVAKRRAEHPEIERLAARIVDTQDAEVTRMKKAHQRLFGEPLPRDPIHETLGLTEEEAGMMMDASALETAKPFDREFIDMMIPHHQGAIRMARIELATGQDDELMEIAGKIVLTQAREIEEMNDWRTKWYGAPSPAGGVPAEDEAPPPSHDAMGHG